MFFMDSVSASYCMFSIVTIRIHKFIITFRMEAVNGECGGESGVETGAVLCIEMQ